MPDEPAGLRLVAGSHRREVVRQGQAVQPRRVGCAARALPGDGAIHPLLKHPAQRHEARANNLFSSQAVSDFPAAAFAFDLITTYPSAKVILNTRDPHAWYESASATVMVALRSPLIRVMSWLDPELLGRWIPMCRKLWRGYFGVDVGDEEHLTRRFMQHYEDVEMIVDKERLLIYRVGEGWGPLCTFLEKEMPDVPFPRVNESASFGVTLNRMLLGSLQRFLGRASVVVVPVVAAGLTAWFARGRMLW